MTDDHLQPGTRVRINGTPIGVTFANRFGTIVRDDQWGTYIIRLDEPGIHDNGCGTVEPLTDIREMADNFTVVGPGIATDDDLIARHIEPDSWSPGRADKARVREHGVSMAYLINCWLENDRDAAVTATYYEVTPEQMAAALAYYARHRAVIDARLTLLAADWAG